MRRISLEIGVKEKRQRWTTIQVHEDVIQKLEECKKEFLDDHPEMRHIPIGRSTMLHKVMDYYLEN